MQMTALDDNSVHSKTQWDQAVKFMEERIKHRLQSGECLNFKTIYIIGYNSSLYLCAKFVHKLLNVINSVNVKILK